MNLLEAFVKLDEDAFDTTPKGIEDLSNFMDDADVVDDEIEIIDPDIDFGDDDTMPADDEESEEENAHVGQLVLQCNTCNALVYKDKDEVELDDEGNVEEEECPNCHNVSKFDVIGKICTVDDLEDELEVDEEESEEKEEDESEKPEEESEEEVEVDDEEEEKPIKEESLRRPNKNKRLVEAPAGDFSYFKSNENDEMSYNRDALRYAKSLLKRHYLDKIHSSSMDDFSKNIGILNDAVKFVEEEFGQDIKSSGSIPRYRELNQEGPVNTICNGYLDLCNDIEKSFNDCYYIWFDSCRDGDDKYTQTPPGLDYTATFSIFDESCIFKIRTTPEGITEYTRYINLPDSVNCKDTYKLAENIVSLIPELKSQFFTFNERKLDEISIRLNQKLDRSLFTFIPLDELREKIKGAMVLKESLRSPRKKSLKEKLVEAPQEVVDELLQILENHGFILDDSIKHENPIRTWMGAIHIQVINPDSFIDEDGDVGYQIKKYVTEELIDEIQALEDRSDCPITWNFGPNADDQVTGGLDVDKQWVADGVNESVRRPNRKSLKENRKKLNEGPGAGYTVSGDLTDIRINSFDFKVNGDEVVVNCDIDADMENVEAYSYYYGGEVGYEVPVKISQVSYYIYGDSQLNDSDVEEELEYDLSHLKFKAYVGGGWSHSTFDGNLEVKDTRHWNEEDSDIFNVIMHCTDEEDIQFIDDLVTGNSEYSEKNEEEFDESLKKSRKRKSCKESIRRPRKKSLKESCNKKKSSPKDKILKDVKKLKKDSLKESSDTPSKETIKDCIEDYRENAFGFDGIKDYVNTQFPKHSSDFKKALIKAMRKQCESLTEDLEGITVDTDEETIQITKKEDGGVAVETSPKESDESFMEEPMFEEPPMEGDEVSGNEEVIEPLTDEEEEEIAEENPESEEGEEDEGDEDEEEIEDIDSDSFDELGESYLKEAYENVKSFKTSKVYKKNGKLVVEGIVSFKSGKNKKTSFIFESAHNKSKKKVLLGENKQITPNSKSFRLRGVVKNKKMVCESLRYNYKEGKNRVSGVCRVK